MVPATLEPPERLQLPDIRRPEQMPFWPEWAASRVASLSDEMRSDETGRRRLMSTIPATLMLTPVEREALEQYADALDRLCDQTPAKDVDVEAAMLVLVTKMTLAFPLTTQNELSSEARGEAYMAAIEDLPLWSVESGIRKWYRGDCGVDERGQPYNYRWCPAPSDLRRVAFSQMWRIKSRCRDVRRLLSAGPRAVYSDEHCEKMKLRLAALLPFLRTSPVGRNGSGEVAGG